MNNKKIAICLRGISYQENYKHFSGSFFSIDYRKCIDSLFKCIIDPLRQNNEVDIFFVTYPSEYKEKIIEQYNAKKYEFVEQINMKQRYVNIANQIKNVMNLVDNSYDYLIVTRFDAFFKNDWHTFEEQVCLDKINFLCRCQKSNLNDDNFIIIPKNERKKFVDAMDKNTFEIKTHRIMQNLDKYNFIFEGYYRISSKRPLILFSREI